MPRYARVKEDGYVMNFSAQMDVNKFDFFETEEPVPEFIADLPAFLSGSTAPAVTARPKKKKDEPVFLKTADGTGIAAL